MPTERDREIDWLDVEEVKAAIPQRDWDRNRSQEEIALEVLKAIVALPEPVERCQKCDSVLESDIHKTENKTFGFMAHEYQPLLLRRIWLVAKEVVG